MKAGDVCPHCGEGFLESTQLAVISLDARFGIFCRSCNTMWVHVIRALDLIELDFIVWDEDWLKVAKLNA